MTAPVSLLLVGIGGYGEVYLSALLDDDRAAGTRIVGAVDPEPQRCTRLAELRQRGVPIHETMAGHFQDGDADLVVISSPIPPINPINRGTITRTQGFIAVSAPPTNAPTAARIKLPDDTHCSKRMPLFIHAMRGSLGVHTQTI